MVSQSAYWAIEGSIKGVHSPIFFYISIDKLEEIVNKVKEGLDGPKLMQELILLLLYVDDVVHNAILSSSELTIYMDNKKLRQYEPFNQESTPCLHTRANQYKWWKDLNVLILMS